jgi:hypothetical protein
VNPTYPRPPRRRGRWANRAEFDKLRRDVITESRMRDEQDDILELRIAVLEELVFTRWPRRIAVRRRLARDLRASVRHVEGATFTEKRVEAIGSGWIRPLWRQR